MPLYVCMSLHVCLQAAATPHCPHLTSPLRPQRGSLMRLTFGPYPVKPTVYAEEGVEGMDRVPPTLCSARISVEMTAPLALHAERLKVAPSRAGLGKMVAHWLSARHWDATPSLVSSRYMYGPRPKLGNPASTKGHVSSAVLPPIKASFCAWVWWWVRQAREWGNTSSCSCKISSQPAAKPCRQASSSLITH
jgi:hypothetical protein